MKILVVDDAKDINLMISKYLEKAGFKVLSVFNGNEAIEALRQNDDIDVMLLDIIMPEQDGFDVLDFMQENDCKVPTIGISGGGMAITGDVALKAVQTQVAHILEKPFKPEALMAAIDKVMGVEEKPKAKDKIA